MQNQRKSLPPALWITCILLIFCGSLFYYINSGSNSESFKGDTALHTSGSPLIAVVDAESLVAEFVPDDASHEKRTQTILEIKSATSRVAEALRIDLVLNGTGKTLNGIPVISNSKGVVDLTEEVRNELAK